MKAALDFIFEQIRGVWRFRGIAMLVAGVVCLVGWFVILLMPDTYNAWARVVIDTRIGVGSNITTSLEVVRSALLGGPQLEKVAKLAIPSYASASPAAQQAIINGLRQRLTVEVNTDKGAPADLYLISYTDNNARNAHHVVDQLLSLFVSNTLGGSQLASYQAKFLRQQIAQYERELQAEESKLADFKRENAELVPDASGDYFSSLHAATDDLEKQRVALILRMPGADTDTAREIRETQARLDELMLRFTEFARLNRDYDVTRGKYQTLVDRLNRAKISDQADATGVVRFEVVDPPTGSDYPVSPDRPRLALTVLLGGLAAGLGVAYLMHQLLPSSPQSRLSPEFPARKLSMRIRILGQHVPMSIAVLLFVEGAIAYFAYYAAALIRYRTPFSHLTLLQIQLGPLWPRARLFAVIVVLCLLAFGLYSARQRAQLSGVLVRVGGALVLASCALAATFYLLPSLQLWRGVEALAVLITGIGLVIARLVFRVAS